MPSQVSAVESISPAFSRMKQLLFKPFRFGLWVRLAVVSVVTGEIGGGGGGSGSMGNINPHRGGDNQWTAAARFISEPGWEQIQPYLFWIVLGVIVALGLLLLWIYSDCVFRFILLDSVISGQCRLREGWKQWREAGRQYLLWVIAFGFGSLFLLGIVGGVPVLLAYHAGWFEKSDEHTLGLIAAAVLLALFIVALLVALAIIDLFARDFLIPVMALENVDAVEGWRKLLGMLNAEKGAYALYVLMKIVLSVGSAILFTIVNIIVLLILLIPLAAVGVAAFFIGKGAGMTWDISTILLVAGFGLLAIAGILCAMGFVYSPGLVFFQSYTLEFFAARYAPLASRMFPSSAPTQPPITPLPTGESFPPPEPSSA